MLTSEQRRSYADRGYVVIERIFSETELTRWSEHFEHIVLGDIPKSRGMVVMEDVMVARGKVQPQSRLHAINKLMNFEDDGELYNYVEHPDLLTVANELVGRELHSLVTNVFNKPPDIDGRHPLHQDLRYFRLRPANLITAAWTAISPATRERGCLAVVPGSHKGPLLTHEMPNWEDVNYAFYGVRGHKRYQYKHLELEPGDTVFFHPLLVHGSGRNTSQNFRRSISTHFASSECISPAPDWRDNDRVRAVAGS